MMKEESELSYLYGGNAPYVEGLYEQYLINPNSISDYWKTQFDLLTKEAGIIIQDQPRLGIEESFRKLSKSKKPITTSHTSTEEMQKQVNVLRLIYSFRILGSRYANLDPLGRQNQKTQSNLLDPEAYNLNTDDLSKKFYSSSNFNVNNEPVLLSEIISKLKQTYCGSIGIEYMHIINTEERHWVRDRFESELSTPNFNNESKKNILYKLTAAETFERYLHTKFVGQKRFSLEGGESLIPGLDYLINEATKHGVESIVIGMAHRGRLNVLINTLGKSPQDLFDEFTGTAKTKLPSGDVKYHNGFTADLKTESGSVHISLEFNPSHLEIVNPVVQGNVRARQRRYGANGKTRVLPILIHGDAALSGLGVNQATFNLSQVRGYTTGGTVHIVVNNQIGFTTSDTRDLRSTTFCTDIAKMIDAPIIHVNGDDPEAMCYVIKIALEFRTIFHKDIIIDMVCYRRLGHNEGDDPFITQPMMYKAITKRPTTRTLYAEKLIQEGILSENESEKMIQDYRKLLDEGKHVQKSNLRIDQNKHSQNWEIYKNTHWTQEVDTSLSVLEIQSLTNKLTEVPENFQLHRTVAKLIEQRKKMGSGETPMDWGMAETLAYASLVAHGNGVRISGEDSGRGTFSHRHAVFHDQDREKWDQGVYIPLQNISEDQAYFMIVDSILNEEAVLAYEYGFACSAPTQLVIWEAQFGDFVNGAQVAIDQFITSGEAKWGRLCGLTVLLPHGYDGQGPEHSSGRLERWLQLCADDNIQVVYLSEAAQMFHVLRRQILRPYRKPLVIFMSKRLLRFKDSMSDISDFINGSKFRNVIGDNIQRDDSKVKRIIICTGQIYYDIKAEREKRKLENKIAIIRIEQLYPFPCKEFKNELDRYSKTYDIKWVQEEPLNQGAWYQILHHIQPHINLKQKLSVSARPASSSPAVGYKSLHVQQLNNLLDDALTL
ncbi:MAG: 2-oxoglutarate dehydrogenase E1 component [Neisseriaceae bacterium]|nr:MAG: 2-oxoglutarate dehydrogenase E1 component [Neisseriaceae bacterium]